MNARSYLFVPADRPERFAKALAAGADAVVIDLEDAVAPARKREARDALANWLADTASAASVVVRINAAGAAEHGDDLRACAHPCVAAVMVPKAEDAGALAQAAEASGRPLVALVESARGIDALRAIAGVPAVGRIAFGSIDFQVDLGIEGEGEELLFFRSQIVLASRLAGLAAPVDGVTTSLDDAAAITRDTARARRLGFGAKLCIHPKQVAAVHEAFMPGAAELDWARRVVAATQASGGAAVAVDGKMVDTPVLLRAQTLIARASPP